ncbi:ribonuclease P protein component [Actinomycetospora endophytica]|uniref:Ribonuclease P protein component n=1 Tax=Actinomycetospora endophytica TaxID=2291215 RepID=A0ABS8P6E8_9PSEU|nr:ribonuclease P protein component [Actinomycetospora endophytica]MCD2193130.1 ribonuclease P protein component [Actinomycetospora endophytica]
MLPRPCRVRRPDDFRRILRRGRKAGRRRLSVHVLTGDDDGSRAGFVVGRTVGGSVERHRVTRRLRHLVGERLAGLPDGTALVVRAHPAAAGSSSAELGADLDAALRRLGFTPDPRPAECPGPAVVGSG